MTVFASHKYCIFERITKSSEQILERRKKLLRILKHPLFLIVLLVGSSYNVWYSYLGKGEKGQFVSDVDQYYSYLPGLFIHNDLSFSYPNDYWLIKDKEGHGVAKGTMGMAMMYSPSFFAGHTIAKLSDKYETNGYSKPYKKANHAGSVVYMLIAIYFLHKSLKFFFSKRIAYLTTLCIFFGTNYFFYVLAWGELPHSYLFFLYSLVIYLTILWHRDFKAYRLLLIALICGLATLIRPTEIITLLFPLLYGIHNKESLRYKLQLLGKNWVYIILAALCFMIPIVPQLFYWKAITGNWVFYSYGNDESFFFSQPKLLQVLFSYRKGLLIYTPMLAFAFAGFFFMRNKVKEHMLATTLIFVISLFLISSWWCWWFGGAFGMRALIQYYVFLAFPMAAFFSKIAHTKYIKWGTIGFASFFIWLNVIQSLQYTRAIIHWDSMTKASYWTIFGKLSFSAEESAAYNNNLKAPDYEKAKKGEDEYKWEW